MIRPFPLITPILSLHRPNSWALPIPESGDDARNESNREYTTVHLVVNKQREIYLVFC